MYLFSFPLFCTFIWSCSFTFPLLFLLSTPIFLLLINTFSVNHQFYFSHYIHSVMWWHIHSTHHCHFFLPYLSFSFFCCVLVVFNYLLCSLPLPAWPKPFASLSLSIPSLLHLPCLSYTFSLPPLSCPSLLSSVLPSVHFNPPSRSCSRGAAEEQGTRGRGGVD